MNNESGSRFLEIYAATTHREVARALKRHLDEIFQFSMLPEFHVFGRQDDLVAALEAAEGRPSAIASDGLQERPELPRNGDIRTLHEMADGMLRTSELFSTSARGNILPFNVYASEGAEWERDNGAMTLTLPADVPVKGSEQWNWVNLGVSVVLSDYWTSPEQRETLQSLSQRDLDPKVMGIRIGAHEMAHVMEMNAHPEWRNAGVLPDYPNSMYDDLREIIGGQIGKPAGLVTLEDLTQVLWYSPGMTVTADEVPAYAVDNVVMEGPGANSANAYITERLGSAIAPFKPGSGAILQEWRGRAHTLSAAQHQLHCERAFPVMGPMPANRKALAHSGRHAARPHQPAVRSHRDPARRPTQGQASTAAHRTKTTPAPARDQAQPSTARGPAPTTPPPAGRNVASTAAIEVARQHQAQSPVPPRHLELARLIGGSFGPLSSSPPASRAPAPSPAAPNNAPGTFRSASRHQDPTTRDVGR
ncbi:hypothetical protein OG948_19360 [Embleya sp. NBC_00888]|uniref:hypothetical protein n=1 Tax=Embleya sp. NBC_00888 TaxID=2975960 RepID=UPI003869722D|nr:hypothetical protein OG948_19360 [Embleya sp. NBC_00888]